MLKNIITAAAFLIMFSSQASADTVKDELQNLYIVIDKEYVGDFDAEKFTEAAVSGLSSIDSDIKITKMPKNLYFYHKEEVIKIFPKPQDKANLQEWIDLSARVEEFAFSISPKLQLKDFMIFDSMAESAFKSLDEYSKYYPSLEDADNIKIKRYFGSRLIDNVLYVKIKTFNKLTYKKLKDELTKNRSAKGLILDLRGNRGGLLSEALNIADLFLEKGNVIVSIKTKNDDSAHLYTAKKPDFWKDKPVVLLVDGDTASSAELLTAALKEQGRAKVVGTGTFGKGTVQNLKIIDEDRGFALTNAFFFTPSDTPINKHGIEPDFCVVPTKGLCPQQNRETINDDIDEAMQIIKQYL